MEDERKLIPERMIFTMDRKKKEKSRSTLTSAQEISYAKEFKRADRAAGGFYGKKGGNQ